jgi:hypothetical protein
MITPSAVTAWVSTASATPLPPAHAQRNATSVDVLTVAQTLVQPATKQPALHVEYLRYNFAFRHWEAAYGGLPRHSNDPILAWAQLPRTPLNEEAALAAGWICVGTQRPNIEEVQSAPFSSPLLVVLSDDTHETAAIVTLALYNHRHKLWMALDGQRLLSVWADVLWWQQLPRP